MIIPENVLKIAEDIRIMRIRGAGRIARAAAHGLRLAAQKYEGKDREDFIKYMKNVSNLLKKTRPTAVSLPNAVTYVISRLMKSYEKGLNLEELKEIVINSANEFITYSLHAIKRIGEIGAGRLLDGDIVMTHCNSSAALSVIITACIHGKNIKVYATETRPKYQGYITYKTLSKNGIDVTLIPDAAARYFMKKVDKVIVGADTVASNGAVVNKIGTSLIALAAHEARVNFLVATETYKFSPVTVIGELVEIEERNPLEIVNEEFLKENSLIKVRNPAFDVTPPEYIDAIITEKGVIP
ncbi:MAG TPA: ribose 1,5-bisphosphate isomerase, partial [Thermoprotei archaeon]|nr:ribose 1,5-bisphosphate isomerase [Thermoprotei archaeon]